MVPCMVKNMPKYGQNIMNNKYLKHEAIGRKRVVLPIKEVQEMHRNTKIDLYSQEFENKLKSSLSFKNLNRYPDVDLLYNTLAHHHQLNNTNILLTSGIDGGLKTVFEMCTDKLSNIVCLTPTYGMYYVYAQAYEVNMIAVSSKEQNLKIDLDELISTIDESIDIVFIPNPHEPVENIFTLDELIIIIEKAKKCDALVFIDEAYYMFGAPTAINLIYQYNNLIVARTFSKGIGIPAIRLGYLLANDKLISYLESKRLSYEVNSLTIDIAIWAIENIGIFKDYVKEVCDSRKWLKEKLHILGYDTHGERSNTILINFKSKEKANFVTEELKKLDIWVRGYLPSPVESYISVTIGSKMLVSKFLEELKKII